MIARLARGVGRNVLATPPGKRLLDRLRRSALLAEDILPYDVHRFDRTTWVLKETPFGPRIWCSLDERAISRPILLNAYEPAEMHFIERTVQPGDIAVDAGGNIGFHAVNLAQRVGPSGRVAIFEPLPYLADALDATIAENAFTARATVHRVALDERPGTLRLRHAPRTDNFGGAHFAPDTALPAAHADDIVTTVRLDDIAFERPVRFIKIDVEGAEPRVIRGALATLARGRPVILSELHAQQLRIVSDSIPDAYIAQLGACGYRCSLLQPDGTRGIAIDRYSGEAPCNVVFDPTSSQW